MLTAGATPEAGKPRPTGPFVFFVVFCAYFPACLLTAPEIRELRAIRGQKRISPRITPITRVKKQRLPSVCFV
jgi:hypothetical protein